MPDPPDARRASRSANAPVTPRRGLIPIRAGRAWPAATEGGRVSPATLESGEDHRRVPRAVDCAGVTGAALQQARAIAKPLGHSCPRTEHVLLAAVSRKLHSPAAELLIECGATPDQVRDQVTRMILQHSPELADRLTHRGLISRIKMRSV